MTAEDVDALPQCPAGTDLWLFDGEPVERWNGAVFHSPGHATAVAAVSVLLGRWCHGHGKFRAFGYGCPYRLVANPDTLLSFDVSVIRQADVTGPHNGGSFLDGAPLLAIEVVELDEDPDLLQRMVETALRCRVGTVWVIDPAEEIVVAHRRDAPALYVNGRMPLVCDDLPGFTCPVADIFE